MLVVTSSAAGSSSSSSSLKQSRSSSCRWCSFSWWWWCLIFFPLVSLWITSALGKWMLVFWFETETQHHYNDDGGGIRSPPLGRSFATRGSKSVLQGYYQDRKHHEVVTAGHAGGTTTTARARDDNNSNNRDCTPKGVHIAQRTNVRYSSRGGVPTVSMTLSFLLDYESCPEDAVALIVYGKEGPHPRPQRQQQHPYEYENEYDYEDDNGDDDDVKRIYVTPKDRIQFNYTSDKVSSGRGRRSSLLTTAMMPFTSRTYRSDYIYHVQIPDVSADETYRYQIIVLQQQKQQQHGQQQRPDNAPHHNTTIDHNGLKRFYVPGRARIFQERTAVKRRRFLRTSITNTTTSTTGTTRTGSERTANSDDDANTLENSGGVDRDTHRGGILGATGWARFRAPPSPGSPTKLALIGDLGQTEHSATTMKNIEKADVSNLIVAGDLSYADSDPHRWATWFEAMQPLLRTTPVAVAAGNHEIECDTKTGDLFVPYESYFRNPNRIRDAEKKPYHKPFWKFSCSNPSQFQAVYDYGNSFYSYQHGLATIIALNSYTDTSVGSPQYTWLLHELQNIDRRQTPWLIVTFHSPLYTTFTGHVNEIEALNMKASMEPLFNRYGVNVVANGHDHAYMRTRPLNGAGDVDPSERAPVYLTLGAGGNRENHSHGYRRAAPEPWVAQRTLVDYGFGQLHMINATHANFQWVRDYIEDGEGAIEDNVWFINYHADRSNP